MSSPSLSLLVLKTSQTESVLAFYETLGLKFEVEQHGKGPIHWSATIGEVVFEIYPFAVGSETTDSATRIGFAVSNLSESVDQLRSAGCQILKEPITTSWGFRAVAKDPDGRAVELVQRATQSKVC